MTPVMASMCYMTIVGIISNNDTQYCAKYHRTNPIIPATMTAARLCGSRDKQHCSRSEHD
jgi:hypothetical protein